MSSSSTTFELSGYVVLGAVLAAFLAVYFYKLIFVYWWPFRQVPGYLQILPNSPIYIPFLAPYAYQGSRQLTKLQNAAGVKTRGLFKTTVFGRTSICVKNLDHLRYIFLTKANVFEKPQFYKKGLDVYGPNIVSIEGGEIWKRHRLATDPAFSDAHLQFLARVTSDSFSELLDRLEQENAKGSKGSTWRWAGVRDTITLATLDVIGKAGFGTDLHVMDKNQTFDRTKYKMSFYDAIGTAGSLGIVVGFFVPKSLRNMWPLKFIQDAVVDTGKYVDELIAYARKTLVEDASDQPGQNSLSFDHGGNDLLTLLVKNNDIAKENGSTTVLSEQELRSDMFIFLLAGHETSSSTFQWIIYELCKHPDVQEKLYQSIVQALPDGRAPTFEDVQTSLEYAQAVVKETLRLHPPVAAISKSCNQDVEIEGFKFPKGTNFNINIEGVHLDPEHWPQPEAFCPERFLGAELAAQKPMQWIPFSFAQRKCSGWRFSLIETVVMLVIFARRYRITFPKEWNNQPDRFIKPISLVTQFPKGIQCDVIPRV